MKRKHAITPTDTSKIPDWRKTNPGYEYSPPRVSRCGRYVELDGPAAFGLTDPSEKKARK